MKNTKVEKKVTNLKKCLIDGKDYMNLVKIANDLAIASQKESTAVLEEMILEKLNEVYTIAWVRGSNDDWSHGEEE